MQNTLTRFWRRSRLPISGFARRPLDLDWLVQFWQNHGCLGTLAEMLENSLTERLNETNADRARRDTLDVVRAFQAMERIGAALVFGRKDGIAIPDPEVSLAMEVRTVDLAAVLPDWSAGDRIRLLTRPVFDPATFGRVRLHNDNEGVVCAYPDSAMASALARLISLRGAFFRWSSRTPTVSM